MVKKISRGENPLSESTYFILLSLLNGPKHGYAILKEVESLSQGRLMLSTGTLYGAIKRLLADHWIERVGEIHVNVSLRERKEYALTDKGIKIFQAEYSRMKTLLSISAKRISEDAAGF